MKRAACVPWFMCCQNAQASCNPLSCSALYCLNCFNIILHRSPAIKDVDQHHNNGNYQQEMNKPSHRVTAHHSRQLQNYYYYSNYPNHMISLQVAPGFTAGLPTLHQPATNRQPVMECSMIIRPVLIPLMQIPLLRLYSTCQSRFHLIFFSLPFFF